MNNKGRPRSEAKRRAVLRATAVLVQELGYVKTSIEAIADLAGCGRQTIYRWWPSKSLLLADAVLEGTLSFPLGEVPTDADLRSDLWSWLTQVGVEFADPIHAQTVLALTAATAEGGPRASELMGQLSEPHLNSMVARLEQGKSAGELAGSADSTAIAEALVGTVLLRLLTGRPLNDRLPGVLDVLIGGVAAPENQQMPTGPNVGPDEFVRDETLIGAAAFADNRGQRNS